MSKDDTQPKTPQDSKADLMSKMTDESSRDIQRTLSKGDKQEDKSG